MMVLRDEGLIVPAPPLRTKEFHQTAVNMFTETITLDRTNVRVRVDILEMVTAARPVNIV